MKTQRSFSAAPLVGVAFVVLAGACGDPEGDRMLEPVPEHHESDATRNDAYEAPDAEDRCVGLAEPCFALPETECADAIGCAVDRHCEGTSSGCEELRERFACGRQRGCEWRGARCEGSAWDCPALTTVFTCEKHMGCDWKEACTGLSTSCATLDPQGCTRQPGCRWDER